MSLRVNGVTCSAVIRSTSPQTAISRAFLASLPARGGLDAITVTSGGESLTVLLRCAVLPDGPDLILGLDWKAAIRELLLSLGRAVPTTFDPFQFYLGCPHRGAIFICRGSS
ncbi:hypothetical protein B0H13DRAFT_2671901 [Mycena leptocephala]|nr:hypothetical protein B0H13DRAFT_2671901 [Mycena leptocephala]